MSELIGVLGQINLQSDLGKLIYKLVSENKFENIVDVGTWNGLGSTYCVLKALEDTKNTDTNLTTVELYPDVFEAAQINLKDYLSRPKFTMLIGRLIEPEEAYWFDHQTIDLNRDAHARLWYRKDMMLLHNSQSVLDQIPEKIDLLILDGGEYTTYPEWQKLKDRVEYFVLDDTRILKCGKIREEVLADPQYEIIADAINDRNGYLVARRK